MDHYLEVSVNEREDPSSEISSRHDSSSSVAKASGAGRQRPSTVDSQDSTVARSSSYHSFPSPSTHRSDSDFSTYSSAQRIDAEYAQYTDAPPPYSEKQYEGKSADEQNNMRMKDYAKEISRMMGRQLVRGLKFDDKEKEKNEGKVN
ncbi:hypothetical protein G6011_11619 [Alternaria panax]|uniref:Uncharacterized protein n=1 Tax=Alternaria panax TaxID=48097 RepID=A0AAD4IE43_9PLEO|nr:hypothetical protein G6011_11619 [Alternaria panax]